VAQKSKNSRRLIPKFLLLLAYAVIIAFLGAIFFMKNELRRIGLFGTEGAAVPAPIQPAPSPAPSSETMTQEGSKPPSSPPSGTATREETKPSSRSVEELTQDDKKQLDDILRARGGKH
jgi:cell division protein FtsN